MTAISIWSVRFFVCVTGCSRAEPFVPEARDRTGVKIIDSNHSVAIPKSQMSALRQSVDVHCYDNAGGEVHFRMWQ